MPAHILLVEDSRTQALRFQLELARCGLQVEIATTGAAGIAAAHARPPGAIVLDVDLPEMDGYSVCRALKTDAATAHIPVVMLTHRDAARDTQTGLEAGAEDYIPKDSFASQNLIEALRMLGVLS